MRKGGAVILGLIVLGISLSGMMGASATVVGRCAAGVACPLNAGVFAAASFNSGFAGGASQAAFIAAALISFLIVAFAALSEGTLPDVGRTGTFYRIARNDGRIGTLARKLMDWRSLFEMSPSAA